MEAYKPPESNVDIKTGRPFKPVMAILLGLLVSVVLATIVSTIEVFVAAMIAGISLLDDKALLALTEKNTTFQLVDTIISLLVFYFAGRIVRKYTPHKEILYGSILSVITFAILLYMTIATNAFSTSPTWYNIASFIAIFAGIFLGAKPRKT